jgi:hypothetical protein
VLLNGAIFKSRLDRSLGLKVTLGLTKTALIRSSYSTRQAVHAGGSVSNGM